MPKGIKISEQWIRENPIRSGRLVTTGESFVKDQVRMVECLCDCGEKRFNTLWAVRNGKIASCGCLHREMLIARLTGKSGSRNQAFTDLTGRRFGRLVCVKIDDVPRKGRGVWWIAQCDCGVTKSIKSEKVKKVLSCGCYADELFAERSRLQVGTKNHKWSGGRYVNAYGYTEVNCRDHPRRNASNRVTEHTLVMEEKIGRFLLDGETVHHLNGERGDNRPENLELWESNHPSGQRHSDKMNFYIEALRTRTFDEELKSAIRQLNAEAARRNLEVYSEYHQPE